MHVDALDDSDSVYAQLVNWVDYWAERLSVAPPATLLAVWRNESDVQGFRGTVTPPGAGQLVGYLTTWLLIWHDEIAAHEFGRAYFDNVSTIIRSAQARYPRAPRGDRHVLPRPCSVCDHFAFGAEWASEDVADFVLRCEHCGHEEPAGEHLATEKATRHLVIALSEERNVVGPAGHAPPPHQPPRPLGDAAGPRLTCRGASTGQLRPGSARKTLGALPIAETEASQRKRFVASRHRGFRSSSVDCSVAAISVTHRRCAASR